MIFLPRLHDFYLFFAIYFTCKITNQLLVKRNRREYQLTWLSVMHICSWVYKDSKHTGKLTVSRLARKSVQTSRKPWKKQVSWQGEPVQDYCHLHYCCHDLDPKLSHDLDLKTPLVLIAPSEHYRTFTETSIPCLFSACFPLGWNLCSYSVWRTLAITEFSSWRLSQGGE